MVREFQTQALIVIVSCRELMSVQHDFLSTRLSNCRMKLAEIALTDATDDKERTLKLTRVLLVFEPPGILVLLFAGSFGRS